MYAIVVIWIIMPINKLSRQVFVNLIMVDRKWKREFGSTSISVYRKHFCSPQLRQATAALRCHVRLKLMCTYLIWKSRPTGMNEKVVHRVVCLWCMAHISIKSSMRMWSNCSKLSINNEPWKRWWQSLYSTDACAPVCTLDLPFHYACTFVRSFVRSIPFVRFLLLD